MADAHTTIITEKIWRLTLFFIVAFDAENQQNNYLCTCRQYDRNIVQKQFKKYIFSLDQCQNLRISSLNSWVALNWSQPAGSRIKIVGRGIY